MRCEEVQPILLDYSRGLLSGVESREIASHLDKCAECAEVLEEEVAFAGRLASLPAEVPGHDVWALVRAKTRPRRFRPVAWLGEFRTAFAGYRTAVAAATLAALAAVTLYSVNVKPVPPSQPTVQEPARIVQVKWSDDPIGGHTDAMVDVIDKM